MILHINDSTNSAKDLYYQSLILLFLPCEKFGAKDTENALYVNAYCENNRFYASVRLEVGNNVSEFSDFEDVDASKYAQMKNLIGRTLLKAAFQIFKSVPPWGISTGVKPVKLARIFLSRFTEQETFNILTEQYMISSNKAHMSIEACKFEDALMAKMGDNPCSLYISIPFCPTKCNYCSFVSCTTQRLLSLIPQYMSKLVNELHCVAKLIKDNSLNLKSIYVGGGTPAILDEKQIDMLLNCVYSNFKTNNCEFTFEAGRPDCITFNKLKVLSDYGVDRISINTQSTNDAVLSSVGRCHSFSDYVSAIETARKFNFKCINTDLIAGLPGESVDSFKKSIVDVSNFSPENITVHAFTLKKSSNFRIDGETDFDNRDNDAAIMTDFATDYLSDSGYSPYYVYRQKNTIGNLENVGYSKQGKESLYNIIMMGEYHTVFGVGAGSVTKIVSNNASKVDRVFAPKYPYEFLDENKYKGINIDEIQKFLTER